MVGRSSRCSIAERSWRPTAITSPHSGATARRERIDAPGVLIGMAGAHALMLGMSVSRLYEMILIASALTALSLAIPSDRALLVLRTDVATVGPRTTLGAARRALALVDGQPLLPVIGPRGPCGLIMPAALGLGPGLVAADVMSSVVTAPAAASPRAIRRLMRRHRLPAIAAVDPRGALVGLFVEVFADEGGVEPPRARLTRRRRSGN